MSDPDRAPRSLTLHYTAPPAEGPAPTVDLGIHFRRDLPLAGAAADDFYLAVMG